MLVVVLPSHLLSHWTCEPPWWRAASSGPYHQWTCVLFASFEPCRAGDVVVGVNCLTGKDGRSTGKRDRCGNLIGLSRWACGQACLLMEYKSAPPFSRHSRLLFIPPTLKTANNRLKNGAPGCFVWCLGGRLCRLMRTAVMSEGFSGVSERDPSWASAAGNNFLM